jgi:hypothetical protein
MNSRVFIVTGALGGKSTFFAADVGEEDDVRAMVHHSVVTHGRLDGAFNNTGVHDDRQLITELPAERWARTMRIIAQGIFHLISRVTDAVLEEVKEWQARPLDACYPIVFFDALRVKIRDEGLVRNKAVYVALALDAEGHKHVLGLWIEQTEGAKFWLKVMNDLKTRGLGDILIAVDGLKGFPEAIGAAFPETIVQTCWCGRPPNGITMCQVEVVANLKKETVRGTSYPSWRRHVKTCVSAAWRKCRRAACPAQEAAPYGDDGVEKLSPTVIAIEACGASHHLARLLTSYGHEVKLIAPSW